MLTQQEKLDLIEAERARNSVRNPGLSVLLSFFIIGLGQIYNGKISKGLILLLSHILFTILGINLFLFEDNFFVHIVGNGPGLIALRLLYIFCHFTLFFYNLRDAFLVSKYSGIIQKFQNPEIVELNGCKYLMLGYESDNLPVVRALDENIPQKYQNLESDVMVSFAWKRIVLFSIIVFLIGVFAGKAVFYQLEENKIIGIEKNYEKRLLNDPDNYDLLLEYSDHLVKMEKNIKALNLLKKAVSLKPELSAAHFSLGIVYRNLGIKDQEDIEFKKAMMLSKSGLKNVAFEEGEMIDDWINAIRKNPKNSNAYFNLGKIYYAKGMTQEAIYSLSKAIDYKSDYFESYFVLGEILEKNGEFKAALKQYNDAYKFQQDNVVVLSKLANLNHRINQNEQADHFYDILYKKNELNTSELLKYIENKISLGDTTNSTRILDNALSRHRDETGFLKLKLKLLPPEDLASRTSILEKIYLKNKKDYQVLNELITSYTRRKMVSKGNELLDSLEQDYFKNLKNLEIVLNFYASAGNVEKQKKYMKLILSTTIPFPSTVLESYFSIIQSEGFKKQDVLFLQDMSMKFPNSLIILDRLAFIFSFLKEIDNEIETLKKILILKPTHLSSINRLASIYLQKDKLEDALIFYIQMEKIDKGNTNIYNSLLKIYISMGAHKKAIETLKKILEIKGNKDVEVITQIYNIAKKNLLTDDLLWSLVQLSEIDRNNQDYIQELAAIYKSRKEYSKSIKIWEEILSSNPISQAAMYELKDLYSLDQQDSKLKMILERIVFYNRQDILSNQELAAFYEKMGDTNLEYLLWENVISMYPLNLKGLKRLAVLYKSLGNNTKLIGVLDKLLLVDSDHKSDYARELFDCYIRIGDTGKAIEYGELLLSLNLSPEFSIETQKKMIPLYVGKKQYRKVIPIYETLIRENPSNTNALSSLLIVYEQLSNIQKQEELLNQLISIEKDPVEYEKKLLMLLIQQNQFIRSEKIFRKLVEKNAYLTDSFLTKIISKCISNKQSDFLQYLIEFIRNRQEFLKNEYKEIQSMIISSEYVDDDIGISFLNSVKAGGLDDDITNFYLGRHYYQKQDFEKSLKYLKDVKFERGDLTNRMRADIHYSLNEKNKAIYYYKESLKFSPDQNDLKLKIAEIYNSAFQYKTAITWASEVIAADPLNRDALILLGIINKRMKNYTAAEKHYLDALTISRDSKVLLYLGYVLERTNKYDDAFTTYLEAYRLGMESEQKEILENLNNTCTKVSNLTLSKSVNDILEVKEAGFLNKILLQLEKEREIEAGTRIAECLLGMSEKDLTALNFMGNLYYNNSQYEKAEEYYSSMPATESLDMKLAIIRINTGRPEEAREILTKLVKESKNPSINAAAANLLGTIK